MALTNAQYTVHEGLGHQQPQSLVPSTQISKLTLELGHGTEAATLPRSQTFQDHEANVMSCVGVAVAWVPQPHH